MGTITINKNRGWRGLAEVKLEGVASLRDMKMIFSFSQDVWNDMLNGCIVLQDYKSYYVVYFDNFTKLPSKTQQRSVLIKNFTGTIRTVNSYSKDDWNKESSGADWLAILHFKKNNNKHTTSNWNCIGIRVIPEI